MKIPTIDYSKTSRKRSWKLIRSGEIDHPTAGECAVVYAQANLVILPSGQICWNRRFRICQQNPETMSDPEAVEGTPDVHEMVSKASNIRTDIPRYFIYMIVRSFRREENVYRCIFLLGG